jgi:hypothetical protein
MSLLLSRKEVEALASDNPMAALARCDEILSRQTIRDTKREAWKRLADRIRAMIPKAETAVTAPKPVKAEKAKPAPKAKAMPVKPVKAAKGVWQVGSRIVPYTTKAAKGLFGGEPCTLSDETWRYLSRPIAQGRCEYLQDPASALYDHYLETGHRPNIASVKGCGDRTLLAMALDGEE